MHSEARPLNLSKVISSAQLGEQTNLVGWVKSKRVSKNCAFIMLNDGSQQADLQLVVDISSPAYKQLELIQTGASIRCKGKWSASPGKGQSVEVVAETIDVIGSANPETYPLQKKGHTLEFLREIAHLRARTNTFGAVFRIRNTLSQSVHHFFQGRGFTWLHAPILTASDCEGAGEMFQVTTLDLKAVPKKDGKIDFDQDFFGKQAHLTVSGQLEGEAFAQCLRDIYTFGPTFRAENSNTSRHLAEFWMIEPEMAFATLDDNMELAESFLKFLLQDVLVKCRTELEFLDTHYKTDRISELTRLCTASFARISYTEAVDILLKSGAKFEFPVKWGIDLQSEHERYLTDQVFKGPVFVTDYPKDIKAFYMRMNDDGKTVRAMDVLVPRVGEIIGGSQREEREDLLLNRMANLNIPAQELDWYLDLRRFGSTPHCGFGAGFERLVQYVSGMANIRDTIPFPRHPGSIAF